VGQGTSRSGHGWDWSCPGLVGQSAPPVLPLLKVLLPGRRNLLREVQHDSRNRSCAWPGRPSRSRLGGLACLGGRVRRQPAGAGAVRWHGRHGRHRRWRFPRRISRRLQRRGRHFDRCGRHRRQRRSAHARVAGHGAKEAARGSGRPWGRHAAEGLARRHHPGRPRRRGGRAAGADRSGVAGRPRAGDARLRRRREARHHPRRPRRQGGCRRDRQPRGGGEPPSAAAARGPAGRPAFHRSGPRGRHPVLDRSDPRGPGSI